MPARLRCSLLCEDNEHEQLFRPILERNGRVRVRVEPRRKEGGFPFVLARLADAARFLLYHPGEAVGLLVVIDADVEGFQRRNEKIRDAMYKAGLEDRHMDRVALCIPARNVETWELWLCGERDLDEQADFKSRFHREVKPGLRPRQLVEAWFAELTAAQKKQETRILPALALGREEIRRLRNFSKP